MANCSKITDYLYIGNQFCLGTSFVEDYEINMIVSAIYIPTYLEKQYEIKGIKCHQILFNDDPNVDILKYCEKVSEIITQTSKDKPTNRTLVICTAGKSRSASLVIYHLMKSEMMPFSQVYQYVKQRRPCIELNRGFYQTLSLHTI